MPSTLATPDQTFAEDLVSEIDAAWVRSTFSGRYRRGWQRKLASNLGIAESTMSGWLKSGQIPEWAKLAMGALVLRDKLSSVSSWRTVRTETGYAVYSHEAQIGVLKADNIPTAADAFLIAAAPALYEGCGEAWAILDDAAPILDVWEDTVQRLREALDAAKPEPIQEHPANEQTEK